MAGRAPEIPVERATTVRESLWAELGLGPATLKELSERVGASEKELQDHLAHLARSIGNRGVLLRSEPARCLGCGFVFRERTRYGRPGKCPACRSTRITPPRFWIEAE